MRLPTAGVLDDGRVTDSHGIPANDLVLTMWAGNAWDIMVWPFWLLTEIGWTAYSYLMGAMLGNLQWVLDLGWVDWLMTPLKGIAAITGMAIEQVGLMTLMLTILGCVAGWWLLKGRYAGGIVELIIGCTIAALAVGVLANPMAMISGESGYIQQSRDAGADLASLLTAPDAQTSAIYEARATGVTPDGRVAGAGDMYLEPRRDAGLSDGTISSMVDALIRTPHQIIVFGDVIDGTPCESVYTEAFTSGADRDEIRESVGACDDDYQAHADEPNIFSALKSFEMWLVLGAFSVFACGLMIVFILAVLGAGWQGIKLIYSLIVGIAPGGGRASVMRSFAMLVFSCLMIVVASAFTVGWMYLQIAFWSHSDGIPFWMRVRFFNLLLIVGAVALLIARHKIKKGLQKAGNRLAQLGASNAQHQPSKLPGQVAGAGAYLGYQAWKKRSPKKPPKVPSKAGGLPPAADNPLPQLPPGPSRPQIGPGPSPLGLPPGSSPRPPKAPAGTPVAGALTAGPSKAVVLRSRLGKAGAATVAAGAIMATGGTGAVLALGAKAATGAKVAAGAKAATAGAKAATTARSATVAARSAKTAKVISRATTAARRTTDAVQTARTARANALRARLSQAHMSPHRAGMVDQDTGVTYRRQTAGEGDEKVEVYRPSGVDPAAVRELRSRLSKPARMAPRGGRR